MQPYTVDEGSEKSVSLLFLFIVKWTMEIAAKNDPLFTYCKVPSFFFIAMESTFSNIINIFIYIDF